MATYTQPAALASGRVESNLSASQDSTLVRTASISLTANPVAADIHELFKLPKGAVVTQVSVNGTRIDTNASATLALSLGFKAGKVAAAAPTALLASAVSFNSATVGANNRVNTPTTFPLLSETLTVIATFDAVAATFAAGTIGVRVEYTTPGNSVS